MIDINELEDKDDSSIVESEESGTFQGNSETASDRYDSISEALINCIHIMLKS
jgi:hypothetical protein